MKSLIISDLHLDKNEQDLLLVFKEFCEYIKDLNLDRLYIIGDFFNKWLKPYSHESWVTQVISSLNSLNCQIYFQRGNRDFLVDEKLTSRFNAKFISDDYYIDYIDGIKILFCHGDTLCISDTKYLKFRKFITNPITLKIIDFIPFCIQKQIIKRIGRQPNSNTKEYVDVDLPFLSSIMKQYDVNIMIHGHTHIEKNEKVLDIDGNIIGERWVLGTWEYLEPSAILIEDGKIDFLGKENKLLESAKLL